MAASLHVPLGCLQGTGHAQLQGTMRRTLNALGLVARAHKLVDTNSAVTSSRGWRSIAGDEDLVDGMQHHWTTEGHVTLNNCVIKGPEDVGEHGARLYHPRGKQSDKAAGCAETQKRTYGIESKLICPLLRLVQHVRQQRVEILPSCGGSRGIHRGERYDMV